MAVSAADKVVDGELVCESISVLMRAFGNKTNAIKSAEKNLRFDGVHEASFLIPSISCCAMPGVLIPAHADEHLRGRAPQSRDLRHH